MSSFFTTENMQGLIVWSILILIFGLRFLRFHRIKKQIPLLISQGAVVIDVRTQAEYIKVAKPGSLNIPLHQISDELNGKLKDFDKTKPIILCCRSGTRSKMAAKILRRAGFTNVYNAGPWRNTL